MDDNILKRLKDKEKELDILLEKAKNDALMMVDDAKKRAKEIDANARKKVLVEGEALRERKIKKIEKEASAIVSEANKISEEIETLARERFEDAVKIVLNSIIPVKKR